MCDQEMEDLIITAKEHKILQKCKKRLQKRFKVTIRMPKLTSAESESDIIFVSIIGETHNRERVKNFLSKKANVKSEKVECKENVVLITLSDSEDEARQDSEESSDSAVDDTVCIIESSETKKASVKKKNLDDSVCVIESSETKKKSVKKKTLDDSVCIIESSETKKKSVKKGAILEDVEICEVSSTTGELKRKPAEEFIPLHKSKKARFEEVEPSSSSTIKKTADVLIIEDPLPSIRPLRPIVIDGSNVAREHGKVSNTFSVKGIKIAVDYFLNRGHTQVTAFVPRFRRFCNRKHFPTTDAELLDDLEKTQHVVFTPSRRVNGKCIASYDDRFVVQLASSNGGVILSNDNYRDLITESDSFKEVIEKRLLLFCFVGDLLMIPSDPLGRAGPSLDHFLSFPPEAEKL